MKNPINSKIPKDIYRPDWLIDEKRDSAKLWLDKNENTDKNLSKFLKNIFIHLKPKIINSYPSLAKIYRKLSNFLNIKPKQILLTHGSDGGIKSVFETFINPNDIVIRTEPTFAMYEIYIKIYKAREILIKYDKKLSLDINYLIKILRSKKPKLLCLPNPDSPTGQIVEAKLIKRILDVSKKTKTFVLIDEAYFEYYNKTNIYKINKYPNLIVARTTGKAYGLAGARVGYLIANENIIKKLHQTKPMYEINHIGAEIFYQLLNNKNYKFITKIINEHLRGKKYFINELQKLKYEALKTYSNFIIVNFKENTLRILSELKKICYIRYFKEGALKGKVRFSLTDTNNFKRIIKIIKKVS
jgi:histidinol-phosphate aminotransferase